MADAKDVVAGLTILMKHGEVDVDAQHDELFAGPNIKEDLPAEDKAKLEELGWHYSTEFDCWSCFT